MKTFALAAALSVAATAGLAAPEKYVLDPSHSQIVFSYEHLGFSTTYGMFSIADKECALCEFVERRNSIACDLLLQSVRVRCRMGVDDRFRFLPIPRPANISLKVLAHAVNINGSASGVVGRCAWMPQGCKACRRVRRPTDSHSLQERPRICVEL